MNSISSLREKFSHVALKLSVVAALGAALTPVTVWGQSEPAERKQAQVQRTAQSPMQLTEQLARNTYRDEVRQVPYTVQVPYQETETYTEQVPYTTSEAYTDYETTYESEYQCRNVSRTERQCRSERTCSPVPDSRQQCSMERICRDDRHGGQICIDREVCRSVGGTRQECRDNQVCRDVPTRDRECHTVQVPRQRAVTRYRDVTHYRSETRTRQVTRYRTESRCCRPETVSVFDRQILTQVQVNFPQGSELVGNESETVKVKLIGDASSSDASVEVDSRTFKYEVADKRITAGLAQFDLRIVPRFTPVQLGQGSITQLKVLPTNDRTSKKVVFVDAGLKPRVDTAYALTITDLASGQVVHQATAQTTGEAKVDILVPNVLQPTVDYTLTLEVKRAGLNLSAPVQFVTTAKHEYRRLRPEEVADATVSKLATAEDALKVLVRFTDLGTLDYVDTVYSLSVMNVATGQPVHRMEFKAEDVTSAGNAVSIEFLKSVLDPASEHKISIRVRRQSVLLPAPVVFVKEMKMAALNKFAAYRDENKVTLTMIKGEKATAQLQLRDQTEMKAIVNTAYDITIQSAGAVVGQVMLERNVFQRAGTDVVSIPLRMLGSEEDLARWAAAGQVLEVSVRVVRTGTELGQVEFTRSGTLTVTP